ncbi:hypothetical protein [Methylophilus methylotrophus]|uniref:hypothetical protein n=1 Tax=Methylophilus methylotrophus TaxID=17 RepID=UPI0013DE23DE|nr:hypothetical protein [Methylophilus methylotrophus]
MQKNFFQIWGWPIVLATLSTFGLLAALLGTGIWHWFSWLSLAVPLGVMAYYTWKKPRA